MTLTEFLLARTPARFCHAEACADKPAPRRPLVCHLAVCSMRQGPEEWKP